MIKALVRLDAEAEFKEDYLNYYPTNWKALKTEIWLKTIFKKNYNIVKKIW